MKYLHKDLKRCFWCEKSQQAGECKKSPFGIHEFTASIAESCSDDTLKKYGIKRTDFAKS